MVQPVSDVGSNAPENIDHAARVIGRSTNRRKIFELIYTGKRKVKKVSDLIQASGLLRTRVLDAGKRLADNNIVKQTKVDGQTAYEKIGFFQSRKRQILGLVTSPAKLKTFPTKRNSRPAMVNIRLRVSGQRTNIEQVTVDDIESFRKVRAVGKSAPEIGDDLSEAEFKQGLQRILGEDGRFKDWGGETFDLFTSRFCLDGKRLPVALALKGPGTKGKLTPGKMGKNGDQIQRLFQAPASVFLIQYCRQIDPSVLAQMQDLAIVKSLGTGSRVFYCTVDGRDSSRLVRAYPDAFKTGKRRKSKGKS